MFTLRFRVFPECGNYDFLQTTNRVCLGTGRLNLFFAGLKEKFIVASFVIDPKPKKVLKPWGGDCGFADGYISDGNSDVEHATQKDALVEDVVTATPKAVPKGKAKAKAGAKAAAKGAAKAAAKAAVKAAAKAKAKATAKCMAKGKAKSMAKAKAKATKKDGKKKKVALLNGMYSFIWAQGFTPQTCWKVRLVMIVGRGFGVQCLSSSCKFVCTVFQFRNMFKVKCFD